MKFCVQYYFVHFYEIWNFVARTQVSKSTMRYVKH